MNFDEWADYVFMLDGGDCLAVGRVEEGVPYENANHLAAILYARLDRREQGVG